MQINTQVTGERQDHLLMLSIMVSGGCPAARQIHREMGDKILQLSLRCPHKALSLGTCAKVRGRIRNGSYPLGGTCSSVRMEKGDKSGSRWCMVTCEAAAVQ